MHGDGVIVEKITPYTITVGSFVRGFDGDKKVFPLQENGVNINIGADKDIFVIVNGILQQKGSSASYVINQLGSSPNQYSVLEFTDAWTNTHAIDAYILRLRSRDRLEY